MTQNLNDLDDKNDILINDFMTKIYSKKCITYELCPEKSGSVRNLIEKVKKAGFNKTSCMQNNCQNDFIESKDSINTIEIDGFVCTDSPLAMLKQNSGLASIKLQNALKKAVICTISMRDRNSLALSAEIMGLNDFGIRIFLALSGDPLKLGDQPQAKAVFESNSIGILDLLNKLNNGIDSNNNALKEPLKQIYAFSVINSYAKNKEILKNKMESKIKAGAKALFTQPVYDVNVANELLEWCENFNAKHNKNCVLMLGFFPVLRYKSAKFLHDKLPGVFIPNEWLETLEHASQKGADYEKQIGLEMSKNLFHSLYSTYPKIHFMNHNNTTTATNILKI